MHVPDDPLDPDSPAPPDPFGVGPDGAGEPVEVPHRALSPDALRGVVEAFVLREGTDYGAREFSHAEKVQQVLDGLDRGEVRILFDPMTETVTLQRRDQPVRRS
jgi:uncharacterized protein YheU (UPF0270 family)